MAIHTDIQLYIDSHLQEIKAEITNTVMARIEAQFTEQDKRLFAIEKQKGCRAMAPFLSLFNNKNAANKIIETLIEKRIISKIGENEYRIVADVPDKVSPIICFYTILKKQGYFRSLSVRQLALSICQAFGLKSASVRMFYDDAGSAGEKFKYLFDPYIPSFHMNYVK